MAEDALHLRRDLTAMRDSDWAPRQRFDAALLDRAEDFLEEGELGETAVLLEAAQNGRND